MVSAASISVQEYTESASLSAEALTAMGAREGLAVAFGLSRSEIGLGDGGVGEEEDAADGGNDRR